MQKIQHIFISALPWLTMIHFNISNHTHRYAHHNVQLEICLRVCIVIAKFSYIEIPVIARKRTKNVTWYKRNQNEIGDKNTTKKNVTNQFFSNDCYHKQDDDLYKTFLTREYD